MKKFLKEQFSVNQSHSDVVEPSSSTVQEDGIFLDWLRRSWVRVPIVWLSAYTLAILPATSLAAGGLVPDGTTDTKMTGTAGNGTPQINIANPNDKGLSVNKFKELNVKKTGVVIDNSKKDGVSKIGGVTLLNPNLKDEASAILLEQTGGGRSALAGPMEIFGKKADLYIVNPYGISVNGLVTINAHGLNLSAGDVSTDANGNTHISTKGTGTVDVSGNGMDLNDLQVLDIFARGIKIDGPITGIDGKTTEILTNSGSQSIKATTAGTGAKVRLVAGANDLAVDSGLITPEITPYDQIGGSKAAQGGTKPDPNVYYGINITSAGSMYGNSVRLISTERGVGVNVDGVITTPQQLRINTAGDLTINKIKETKYDADGNPVYETEKDSNGKDVLDANGKPVYKYVDGANLQGKDILINDVMDAQDALLDANNTFAMKDGKLVPLSDRANAGIKFTNNGLINASGVFEIGRGIHDFDDVFSLKDDVILLDPSYFQLRGDGKNGHEDDPYESRPNSRSNFVGSRPEDSAYFRTINFENNNTIYAKNAIIRNGFGSFTNTTNGQIYVQESMDVLAYNILNGGKIQSYNMVLTASGTDQYDSAGHLTKVAFENEAGGEISGVRVGLEAQTRGQKFGTIRNEGSILSNYEMSLTAYNIDNESSASRAGTGPSTKVAGIIKSNWKLLLTMSNLNNYDGGISAGVNRDGTATDNKGNKIDKIPGVLQLSFGYLDRGDLGTINTMDRDPNVMASSTQSNYLADQNNVNFYWQDIDITRSGKKSPAHTPPPGTAAGATTHEDVRSVNLDSVLKSTDALIINAHDINVLDDLSFKGDLSFNSYLRPRNTIFKPAIFKNWDSMILASGNIDITADAFTNGDIDSAKAIIWAGNNLSIATDGIDGLTNKRYALLQAQGDLYIYARDYLKYYVDEGAGLGVWGDNSYVTNEAGAKMIAGGDIFIDGNLKNLTYVTGAEKPYITPEAEKETTDTSSSSYKYSYNSGSAKVDTWFTSLIVNIFDPNPKYDGTVIQGLISADGSVYINQIQGRGRGQKYNVNNQGVINSGKDLLIDGNVTNDTGGVSTHLNIIDMLKSSAGKDSIAFKGAQLSAWGSWLYGDGGDTHSYNSLYDFLVAIFDNKTFQTRDSYSTSRANVLKSLAQTLNGTYTPDFNKALDRKKYADIFALLNNCKSKDSSSPSSCAIWGVKPDGTREKIADFDDSVINAAHDKYPNDPSAVLRYLYDVLVDQYKNDITILDRNHVAHQYTSPYIRTEDGVELTASGNVVKEVKDSKGATTYETQKGPTNPQLRSLLQMALGPDWASLIGDSDDSKAADNITDILKPRWTALLAKYNANKNDPTLVGQDFLSSKKATIKAVGYVSFTGGTVTNGDGTKLEQQPETAHIGKNTVVAYNGDLPAKISDLKDNNGIDLSALITKLSDNAIFKLSPKRPDSKIQVL